MCEGKLGSLTDCTGYIDSVLSNDSEKLGLCTDLAWLGSYDRRYNDNNKAQLDDGFDIAFWPKTLNFIFRSDIQGLKCVYLVPNK